MPRRLKPGGPFLGSSLVGQDEPAPFAQLDWEDQPRRKQQGDSTIYVNLLLTTLAVAASVAVVRAPIYSQPHAPRAQQGFEAPNLLLTTLAAPAQAPFAQEDWPNPVARKAQRADDPPNLLGTTLAPAPPDSSTVFRAPIYTPRLVWKAGQEFVAPNLLETTLAPALTGTPVPSFDWPRLKTGLRAIPFEQQNLLSSTLAPPPVIGPETLRGPLYSKRWPLRRATADAVPNLLGTTLAPSAAVKPFSQTDWPKPRRLVRGTSEGPPNLLPLIYSIQPPLTWDIQQWERRKRVAFDPPNLLTSTLATPAVAAPFKPVDWSVRRVPRAQKQDAALNLFGTTLAPPPLAGTPFKQLDWQNPPRVRGRDAWLAPNLQTGTLAPAVVAVPFRQLDWPQPRETGTPVDLRSWMQPVPHGLTDVPAPVVPGVYGWGARGRVGGTPASDPWQKIGSSTSDAQEASIGSQTAKATPGKIG